MPPLRYELAILLGKKYNSVKEATMAGLLEKGKSLVGDDLWIAKLELGIEGGGTIIKNVSVHELEALAKRGVKIGQ